MLSLRASNEGLLRGNHGGGWVRTLALREQLLLFFLFHHPLLKLQ